MEKSKKLTAVYALIMDLPLSIVITFIALTLSGKLSMYAFIINALLAYVLTFFINMLIPCGKIGFGFASKHAEVGSKKFIILINLAIAAIFVVIVNIVMTAVGIFVFGNGTFVDYIFAVIMGFTPCYIATFFIALFWDRVSDKLSRKICKEPVPNMPRAE